MAEPAVDVIVQIAGDDVLAGRLWSHRRGRTESATFRYDQDYLARSDAYELDPALDLSAGSHQTPAGRPIFGAFSDCAPDRWGRRLIARAEKQRARREDRAERSFGEIDLLLGVRDDLRQGALRFRDPERQRYLADDVSGVPSLLDLPVLLSAADRIERDEADEQELQLLLRGGSSLGGARPKAHVLSRDGRIAIAKFPSSATDDWDVMRWEAVALSLARSSGINVPGWSLHEIDGRAVVIVDRFDRTRERRIRYLSAMTMLEAADGEQGSYLEIADAITERSPSPDQDLREVWRRIAFAILISNTDDHLRNHGFLRTSSAGWSLSPAFDLNPNPDPGPKHLSTAIDFSDDRARLDTLFAVAEEFRLSRDDAQAILGEVSVATSHWRAAAERVGLDQGAIEEMSPAFEHEQADTARSLSGASGGAR
jgi:serine/threonine-protein kinase HipA